MTLRLVSLFNKDLRAATGRPRLHEAGRYDARKLQGLLGPPQMTLYDAGIGRTISWITLGR